MQHLMNRRRVIAAAGAMIGFPTILHARSAMAADREKLAVRLDYTPWGIHAPFRLAHTKGWFADVGIEPSFDDGNGSVATVQIVGNGQYDVGHASLGPMAIARGKGVPVRSIATLFGQNDICLLTDKAAGVTRIADIKGKTIAYTPGSLEAPFLDKFLAAGGLSRNDLTLQSVDASAKVGLYVNRRVDGIFSSPTFTLPQFQARRPADVLRFSDHGLNFLGYGLFATEDAISKRSAVLGRFASVVAGTWNYIFAGHEDEAVQAIMAASPQARLQPAVLRGQIEELGKYVALPGGEGSPALAVSAAHWQSTLKILGDAGLVPTTASAADYFTSSLLDAGIVDRVSHGSGPDVGK
ncbi:MAG: ABC transporter substrate-binding protein [Burkholderiaceae bacterium]